MHQYPKFLNELTKSLYLLPNFFLKKKNPPDNNEMTTMNQVYPPFKFVQYWESLKHLWQQNASHTFVLSRVNTTVLLTVKKQKGKYCSILLTLNSIFQHITKKQELLATRLLWLPPNFLWQSKNETDSQMH
jgi:hypothetical protein